MSKNITRKSIALGAGFALALVGVVPSAQAVGEDGLVTLAPQLGTSYKTLLTSAFDLEANFAQSLEESGVNMKFQITDTTGDSKFDLDINGATADAATAFSITDADWDLAGGLLKTVATAELLTITIADDSGINEGDTVTLDLSTNTLDGVFTVGEKVSGTKYILVSGHANDVAVEDLLNATGTITQFGHNGLNTRTRINASAIGTDAIVGVTASTDNRATDDTVIVTASASNNSSSVLRLTTSSATTVSYSVVAWHDSNSDGTIDASESKSPARTVTFVKPSEAVVTTAIATPSLGDLSLSATTDLGDLNEQQLASDVVIRFARNGYNVPFDADSAVAGIPDGTAWADDAVTYVALTTNLGTGAWDIPDFANVHDNSASATNGEDGDLVDSATWSATAYYGGAILGGSSAVGANTTLVNGYSLALDSNANADGGSIVDADIRSGAAVGAAAGKVRSGTKSFNVTVSVTTNTTTKLPIANIPVSVSVTPTNIATADAVTVNGTAITTGAKTITGVTNAAGQFVLAVTTATGTATDALAFAPTIQNIVQNALTVTWTAAVYNLYNTAGEVDTTNDVAAAILPGGTLALSYDVVDQWETAPAAGTTAVTVTRATGVSRTTAATWAYQAAVVGGKASVTIVDSGTGTGTDTVTASLFAVATGGALSGSAINTQAFVLSYSTTAAITGTALTAVVDNNGSALTNGTAVYPVATEALAFVAQDTRYSLAATPAYANNTFADKSDLTADGVLTLSGSLTNAQGAGTGDLVTITSSKSGVLFKVANGSSKYNYSTNSVTLRTANGSYSADIYSQVGGTVTFTVTAGGFTKTVDVTFAAAAAQGSVVTLDMPASAKPGTTFKVVGYLKDAYGNAVAVTTAGTGTNPTLALTYTGPGFISGNLPAITDANGMFTFSVLLGTNDSGTATVSASFDADGTTVTKAAVVTTASTVIGEVASAAKVNAGSFKGYVALYAKGYAGKRMSAKVGKDWVVVAALASNFERVVEFTGAGVDVAVRIYIDRVLMDTINLTTK